MFYFQNAANFLVQAIIGFAIYVVLLRFWMQWVRADFRNQLGQFIIVLTNPVVIPLRKILPSIKTIDTATIVLTLGIAFIKVFTFFALTNHSTPPPVWYLLMSLGVFVKYSIYLFLASIIIQAIASWVNPNSYHPILSVARSISEPILAPARRFIPPLGGLDLSPIAVLLFLQFSLRLIVLPLTQGFPL